MAPVALAVELCVIVAEVTDMLVKAVVPPTAPVKVVVPDPAAIIRGPAPLIVLANDTFPFPVDRLIVSVAGIVTGPLKVRGPLLVVMLHVLTAPVWKVILLGVDAAP